MYLTAPIPLISSAPWKVTHIILHHEYSIWSLSWYRAANVRAVSPASANRALFLFRHCIVYTNLSRNFLSLEGDTVQSGRWLAMCCAQEADVNPGLCAPCKIYRKGNIMWYLWPWKAKYIITRLLLFSENGVLKVTLRNAGKLFFVF